jgi:hypothetical protein
MASRRLATPKTSKLPLQPNSAEESGPYDTKDTEVSLKAQQDAAALLKAQQRIKDTRENQEKAAEAAAELQTSLNAPLAEEAD